MAALCSWPKKHWHGSPSADLDWHLCLTAWPGALRRLPKVFGGVSIVEISWRPRGPKSDGKVSGVLLRSRDGPQRQRCSILAAFQPRHVHLGAATAWSAERNQRNQDTEYAVSNLETWRKVQFVCPFVFPRSSSLHFQVGSVGLE